MLARPCATNECAALWGARCKDVGQELALSKLTRAAASAAEPPIAVLVLPTERRKDIHSRPLPLDAGVLGTHASFIHAGMSRCSWSTRQTSMCLSHSR